MAKKANKESLEDVKLYARRDWVLLLPAAKESKVTKSGLVRPDNDEDDQKAVGTVKSVGRDVEGIQVGDIALYGMFAGEKVDVTEKEKKVEYVLVKDEDIIALVE